MRRTRQRQRDGGICTKPVPLARAKIGMLIAAGLLDPSKRDDWDALTAAVKAALAALPNQSSEVEAAEVCEEAAAAAEAERKAVALARYRSLLKEADLPADRCAGPRRR